MSGEKKIIFDHCNYVDADDFKEIIEDWYGIDFDNVNDNDKWNCILSLEEQNYEIEKENIQGVIGNSRLICMNIAGKLDSRLAGGFIAEDLQDAIGQISGNGVGDIGFYETDEEGLHMTFTQYDDVHDVCIHAITDAGEQYNADNERNFDISLEEADEILFSDETYSTKIYVIS